jgi:2-dehydropantoate 2-reductase
VVAASASEAGHDVTVCVRTPIDRLVLESEGVARTLPVRIVTAPGDLPPAGVVWVTTKITDTAGAGPWLSSLCRSDTLVVAAQNGLDQDVRLAPLVGEASVIPALAYLAAERVGPGRVVHLAGNRVQVPAGDAERRLQAATDGRWIMVRGVTDMRTAAWRKLMGNLVANPITTLTMRRIGVMQDPGIEDLARGLLIEAVQVGRAEGALLGDEDVAAVLAGTGQYGDRTGSSMLYDRLAGRPLEHQFLTGEVVRRAERHGIPAPLNAAVLALLDALDRGRDTSPA